jgi:hypothetical protein
MINDSIKKWKEDLINDPRMHSFLDDEDAPFGDDAKNAIWQQVEFSQANHEALIAAINSCKNAPRTFVEIGVCRNEDRSSTHTIHKFLPKDGIYLGIDINDKSFLDDPTRGIHTIKTSSSNFEEIVDKLKSLGVDTIDFLFIDGWHSINQVLVDWEYSRLLSPGGVIAFHDTTWHPGPNKFINNLDTNKWVVFPNLCPQDYGLGFCYQK